MASKGKKKKATRKATAAKKTKVAKRRPARRAAPSVRGMSQAERSYAKKPTPAASTGQRIAAK